MTSQQRKTIFPMLTECGCPKDRNQRIAWINGLLFANGATKVITSTNDLKDEQASWLIAELAKQIRARTAYQNAA